MVKQNPVMTTMSVLFHSSKFYSTQERYNYTKTFTKHTHNDRLKNFNKNLSFLTCNVGLFLLYYSCIVFCQVLGCIYPFSHLLVCVVLLVFSQARISYKFLSSYIITVVSVEFWCFITYLSVFSFDLATTSE